MAQTIILAVVGSTAIAQLIQYFITRHDAKKGLGSKLKVLEKDTIRTQLLLLILLKPEEEQEILTVGEHYFKTLNGNWYMTSIFNKWLSDSDTAKPEWFKA